MENSIPPNISEVAREMQRRSAASRSKRAAKAGKLAWSKRIKEVFEVAFEMGESRLYTPTVAWEIFVARQQHKVRHQVPP